MVESSLSENLLKEYLDFAVQLKAVVRLVVEKSIHKKLEITSKPDKSFVTSLDTELEKTLSDLILTKYPNHGIIGEELGTLNPQAELVWTIDPIDGTEELVYGLPLYGTIISLLHNGKPVLGLIDHPSLDICTFGAAGLGVFRNGARLPNLAAVSSNPRLYLGSRHQFIRGSDHSRLFELASECVPNIRVFCTCYGFSGLLNSEADVAVEYNLKIWDLAAAEILVQELGGSFIRIGEHHNRDGLLLYGAVFGKSQLVNKLLQNLHH